MPLCTEVGLGPGDIVSDGAQLHPTERGTAAPLLFGPLCCGMSSISATAELLFYFTVAYKATQHVPLE